MAEYAELIKALRCVGLSRRCDTCEYGYRLSPDSECNDACDRTKLENDAADALEAAEQRIAELDKELGIWSARSFEGKIGSMALINLNLRMEISKLKAQLPKRGKWVGVSPMVDAVQCSVCGGQLFSAELETPYCPYCGAEMIGEHNVEDGGQDGQE